MNISENLQLLLGTKSAIRTSINNKGVELESSAPFSAYSSAIDSIQTGGGSDTLATQMINRSGTTSVTVPSGCTRIGPHAFCSWTTLTEVNMHSGITSIDTCAFYECSGLTLIDIPSGVTTIGTEAFSLCYNLESVIIPSGVTNIAIQAFDGCSGLTEIIVEGSVPATLGNNAFRNTNNCPIYVPCGTADTYKAASGWSTYASRIQENPNCTPVVETTYAMKLANDINYGNGELDGTWDYDLGEWTRNYIELHYGSGSWENNDFVSSGTVSPSAYEVVDNPDGAGIQDYYIGYDTDMAQWYVQANASTPSDQGEFFEVKAVSGNNVDISGATLHVSVESVDEEPSDPCSDDPCSDPGCEGYDECACEGTGCPEECDPCDENGDCYDQWDCACSTNPCDDPECPNYDECQCDGTNCPEE